MSREKILAAVKNHQPDATLLPANLSFEQPSKLNLVAKFIDTITLIGGAVINVDSFEDIKAYIASNYATQRMINMLPELPNVNIFNGDEMPHDFENVAFAIFKPHFAVAENGAVWITEDRMGHRVLPFICQHLAMVVKKEEIVATMHQAYEIIDSEYGFGTFIAGPSKTADIEQSLVLGAHGARSMTVFLM